MTDPPPHREALLELYDVLNPEAPGSWVALVDGRLVTARPTTGGIVYSIRVRLNIGHDPANMVPTLGRGYQLVGFYRDHPELGSPIASSSST